MKLIALLFPYRTHLEAELKQQRADFTERLAEKNLQIRMLRGELAAAKSAKESLPKPVDPSSLAGSVQTFQKQMDQVFQGPQDWQGELTKMLDEEIESEGSNGV